MLPLRVTRWSSPDRPTQTALEAILRAEGLRFYAWSNAPHDVYEAHDHDYNKVLYCVSGSITFGLPGEDRQVTIHPGDRIDLPASTVHDAVVGGQGVICLEAHE
jgi:quercetin dioxygenase-like cupin family protein